ncbi:MAG: GxGYxYP family putative glycoside hydrolase, partial [Bacteroidales bacterium]
MGRFYWSVRSESVSLEERLVQESLCGLAALAVNEGNSQTMVWIHSDVPAYQRLQNNLPMQETGNSSIWDLLGKTELMSEWVNGYILYDIDNPESVNIATVASHVYKGILVSINDSARFNKLGYGMLYNASSKTLDECWTQFKDKCNKDGLVLMPPLTSNQRSTAIAYRWMAVNLYKKQEGS